MKFSINPLASAITAAIIFSSSSAVATDASSPEAVDPLACTDEEIQAIMDQYNSSLGDLNKYEPPSFDKYREVRMVHRSQNSDTKDQSLCDIIMNPNYKIPKIELAKLKAAWAGLKALMVGNSMGMDWSQAVTTAYNMGMEKFKEWWRESQCKLAQDLSTAVNESINDAYDDAKDAAEDAVLDQEVVQDAGITDLDNKNKPIWQQVAEQQTENQLGDYAGYANWYETDDWKGENMQESMDDLIDKVIGDTQDDVLDNNLDNEGGDRLDNILDKFEPDYEKK